MSEIEIAKQRARHNSKQTKRAGGKSPSPSLTPLDTDFTLKGYYPEMPDRIRR